MVRTKLLPPPGSLSTLSSHGHHFPLSSGLPKTCDLSFLCHFHVLLLMRLLPRLPPLSCFPHITHTCMSQTRTQVQGTVLTLPAEFAAGPEPRWEWSFSSNLTSKRPGNWSKKGKETYWSSLGLQSHLDATDRHLSCFPLKPFVSHMANLQWMCTKSSTKHIFTTIHLRILDEVIPHISYRKSGLTLVPQKTGWYTPSRHYYQVSNISPFNAIHVNLTFFLLFFPSVDTGSLSLSGVWNLLSHVTSLTYNNGRGSHSAPMFLS